MVVQLVVSRSGAVEALLVVQSGGRLELDRQVVEDIRTAHFITPAKEFSDHSTLCDQAGLNSVRLKNALRGFPRRALRVVRGLAGTKRNVRRSDHEWIRVPLTAVSVACPQFTGLS